MSDNSNSSSSVGSPKSEDSHSARVHVVIVGGSYAGLAAIGNLLDLYDGKPVRAGGAPPLPLDTRLNTELSITLIDERDGFLHTLGTPLCHVSRKHVAPFWRKFDTIKELQRPEIRVVRGSATSLSPDHKRIVYRDLENDNVETTLEYDYIIIGTGLRRDWPVIPTSLTHAEYVKEAGGHVDAIQDAKDVVAVIGGGAVGIEFAGEIKNYYGDKRVVLIHSRGELLSNESLPTEFKDRALTCLKEEGVEVMLNQRPKIHTEDGKHKLTFDDGTILEPGHLVPAFSRWTPVTEFIPKSLLDNEGYVKVKPNLQLKESVNDNAHYAVGDIALVTGIKRAGAALALGRIAAINIYSSLLQKQDSSREDSYLEFPFVPPMMALAVGKQAITYGPSQGVKWGVQTMADNFGPDLGWENTVKYLQLTEVEPTPAIDKLKI